MRVRVLYFGVLKDIFQAADASVDLAEGTSVAGLLQVLRAQTSNSQMKDRVWQGLAVAVNREYATANVLLNEADEVALLPPVSGGNHPGAAVFQVEITDAPIPTAGILATIKAGSDGAVCLFDGIVRDNTRGRQTLYLDYESYREMALDQMRALAREAVDRFGVRDVALVHRVGRLFVGETSVLIVVASAHRGAAFDACRFLIDTLKKTVPIWKKETFVDGVVWADGEPFPDAMALRPAEETTAQSANGEPFPEELSAASRGRAE
jgi:molybdopterin synthase catalytic subunit